MNDIPYYHCDCGPGGLLDPTNLTCVYNANCTTGNDGFSCQCLPGYDDISLGPTVNCTGEVYIIKIFL